jgi:hypothetical protein
MRVPLLMLLGLIAEAFGQWQEMPVPIVAGHPFSADEVTPRKLAPNLTSASGDSTTRLENIERSDPDPSLFPIPSDDTIAERTPSDDNFDSAAETDLLEGRFCDGGRVHSG